MKLLLLICLLISCLSCASTNNRSPSSRDGYPWADLNLAKSSEPRLKELFYDPDSVDWLRLEWLKDKGQSTFDRLITSIANDPSSQVQKSDSAEDRFSDCLNPDFNYQRFPAGYSAKHGTVLDCVPDTLYSWGNEKKVLALQRDFKKGGSLGRPIYFSLSPWATFGYGLVSIRVKLKKDVHWVSTSTMTDPTHVCNLSKDYPKTVVVRYFRYSDTSVVDYILCSAEAIDSWSFGTQGHLIEMRKELNSYRDADGEFRSNQMSESFLYAGWRSLRYVFPSDVDMNMDSNHADKISLLYDYYLMEELIKNKKGAIYGSDPSLTPEELEKSHFATRFPTYFNEE